MNLNFLHDGGEKRTLDRSGLDRVGVSGLLTALCLTGRRQRIKSKTTNGLFYFLIIIDNFEFVGLEI